MTLCALSVQLLSEKISGAEGTKLEEDFLEMERVSLLTAFTHTLGTELGGLVIFS